MIMRPSSIRKKNWMTNYEELNKEEKRKKARVRRKRRNIIFAMILVVCILAVSLDAILMHMYKDQKTINEQLTVENSSLEAENESLSEDLSSVMNSDKYISVDEVDDIKAEAVEEHKDMVRGMFEEGSTILNILETVYSDMIVVPDTGNYYFFEIMEDLAKNELDLDKIIYPEYNEETEEYEGELGYADDSVSFKKGVDVSKFQGDIDWVKVKNDGYEFAYIRAGYRGYEQGTLVEDEKFKDNIEGASDAGMDVGVYFFTEAVSEAEGREEAEFVLDLLDGYSINLPIVIDVEQSSNVSKSRTKDLTQDDRTRIVIAFCERVKEAGYTPMIYGNLKSHMRMTNIEELEEYDKWFAYYRFPLRYPYKFRVWQYSSTGSVDGIKGDTDLNIALY